MKYIFTLFLVALFVVPAAASAQSAAASCAINKNLTFGSTGAEVTKLQTFLKAKGYFKAAMTPRFGPATLAAVKAYQKASGISAIGTVGPQTRAKINASCGGSTSSGSSTVPGTPASTASFEVTGWIPYWRQATGTMDTLPNLDKLTEINPFVYTLKSDGTLMDNGPLDQEPWLSFNATAKAKGVKVIPTVMSGNKTLMHEILSNTESRVALEDHIAAVVKERGFDGIDIDFEGKSADTKDYFSLFLKGLKQRLGSDKWLMCTIETRIPNEDRYFGVDVPPDAGQFANDLKEINKYCDRVRLMTYDQQGIDLKLSNDAGSRLYAPVGDPAWIEKVVNLMSKDIDRNKMLIGIPTYGYEYAVTTYEGGQHVYDILWTFNPGHAAPQKGISAPTLSERYGVTPERSYWGEMMFTYLPNDNATSTAPVSTARMSAMAASAAASMYADQFHHNATYRLVVWPDEVSVQQKIDLAKRLGLRGVAIFKFDGGQDPEIWNTLTGAKQ